MRDCVERTPLAGQFDVGIRIARELISRKLIGQEAVTKEQLYDSTAAQAIAELRSERRDLLPVVLC